MSVARALALTVIIGCAALLIPRATAALAAPACAETAQAGTPASPSPGNPCWVDTTPYPFGADGNPVDPSSPLCQAAGAGTTGVYLPCYLTVTTMAFRAWNRGLAAVVGNNADGSHTSTPFGVWLYNGTRWYPDPTFPGQSVCKGDVVLWAGKLDYWLVGDSTQFPLGGASQWPSLCRFDGANFEWEPISVPAATRAHAPLLPNGTPRGGAITSGACLAWDNCWFFGTYGVVVHWDGQSLTDITPGLGSSPWLTGDFTAATAGTDAAGNPFAFAVAASSSGDPVYANPASTVPAQPDGTAAPQLYTSDGGPFASLTYSPAADTGAPTDLVAIDFNTAREGWAAGDPAGERPPLGAGGAAPEPAPLVPFSSAGTRQTCPTTPPDGFMSPPYNWSSIGVFPTGDAVAGGQVTDPDYSEPVLAHVSCSAAPEVTTFRVPDPRSTDPATAPLIPADVNGFTTSVAANAFNDAWAATTPGLPDISTTEPPHLYHLTDGDPPQAPAGDDNESRPVVVTQNATVFQIAPAVVIPPPPPATTVSTQGKTGVKKVKLKSPIYAIAHPRLKKASGGTWLLELAFKVRRKVTIELEALHGKKVVASSGFKTFSGKRGVLVVRIDRKHWPTGLKFVYPRAKGSTTQ